MTQQQASTPMTESASGYHFIWIGVLFGLGFIFFDVFIDVLVFNEGALYEQLLHPSAPELIMRLSFFVLSTSFGVYAFYALRREQSASARARDAELRLEVLFDSAAEFIFLIDPKGTILRVNQVVSEEAGYSRDEMLGKQITAYLTPASRLICQCNSPGMWAHGYNRADVEFVRKDGTIINMECSATAVQDERGNGNSFLVIQRDITERLNTARSLEDSERRFRAIFNSAFQFIGLLDPQGTLLEANQTALDFIGCSNADVVGMKFWETPWWSHSPQQQERLKKEIAKAAQGKLVRYEGDHIDKQGRQLFLDISLTPVLDERGETILIIPEGRDITEHILAEEKDRRMQQDLAHVMRVGTMGEMAAGMAHELNQPLTALISYCGTALQQARQMPSLPDGYLDILERASEQAHRAGDVIRHLRDFVSKGNGDKTCVVLNDLIQGIINFISWELRDSDIQITLQDGSHSREVFVDKVQIEQVLVNLIRNSIEAIKGANVAEGRVDIVSHLGEDKMIEVTVADNGPGISASVAGVLFEPYQTSKESGMGMGLSISRSIIEAHNGCLSADLARQQKGAMFRMRIPECG